MYELQSKILQSYAKIVKNKLDEGKNAIALVDNIYALLEMNMTYNQFISVCNFAFKKSEVDFDVMTSDNDKIFFIFKYRKCNGFKSSEYRIYTGESRCSLCDNVLVGSEHHIKPRSSGGTDNNKNLVFLCMDCHNSVELFCSYCDNSKTICDKQMFNSCWRRNNAYFLPTLESKEIFDDVNDIPKLKIKQNHKKRSMKACVNKCSVCRKSFPFQLNKCKIVNDIIYKQSKTFLRGKKDKDAIYICDNCYTYALTIEKSFTQIKENQKLMYEQIRIKLRANDDFK